MGGWVVKGGCPRARAARCTGRPLPRQGCCASLRDGLRSPLTREPLPSLGRRYRVALTMALPLPPSAQAASASPVEDLIAQCPSSEEVSAFNADLTITFEGVDPSGGTLVCHASDGSIDLTRFEERAYQALRVMKMIRFSHALPWTVVDRGKCVRRGDKWRSCAELNGAVLASPKDICAGHSVGAVGGPLAKSSRSTSITPDSPAKLRQTIPRFTANCSGTNHRGAELKCTLADFNGNGQ